MFGSESATMARPKGKRTERDDVAVKVDRAIVSKAKLIASDSGITVAELLSDLLKPAIDKAYREMLRRLDQ